ncbi:hypothetical protein [Luteibacter sp. RCC_6_2]|uniref:hypothetical protein n=1 Tax=Luteibacter sp. RCC_6_2 TaxID=3239223 RepID=UPI0035246C84
MKIFVKIGVFIGWVLLYIFLIRPFVPRVLSEFLLVAGTIFVMRLTSRYFYYGKEGLKFWRWHLQQDPRDIER